MIEIEIPGDISDFKPKVIGGLTARQCIFYPIAALGAFVSYKFFGTTLLGILLMIVLCVFPALCGFMEPYGMPLEKFLIMVLFTYYLPPTKRKYVTKNMYEECIPKETSEEKKQRILKTRKKKEKNQKSKNPDIMVFK